VGAVLSRAPSVIPHESAGYITLDVMNYWAKDDPLFVEGHYVEDWELKHWTNLSQTLREFVQDQARRGNKIKSIGHDHVFLASPPLDGLLELPSGFAFACPYRPTGYGPFECEEDGMIIAVETGEYLGPTGTERVRDYDV
jgi:hypothetical protein